MAPRVEVPGDKIDCCIFLRRIPLEERDPKTENLETFFIRKGFKEWKFSMAFAIFNFEWNQVENPFHKSKIQLQKKNSGVNLKYCYFYIYVHFLFCP